MSEKLKRYLSTASSIIASVGVVNADIIYTNVDPDLVVPGNSNASNDYYTIDLNNDAVDDFRIGMFNGQNTSTNSAGGVLSYTWNGVWIEALNSNGGGIATAYTTYFSSVARPFAIGRDEADFIGSSQNFATWGYLGLMSYWKYTLGSASSYDGRGIKGKFNGRGDRYIGVKFSPNGTDTHYGWIRINVASDSKGFSLLDYAYQNISDSTIVGGQMPAGEGIWSWCYDSYYGKQYSIDSPITHTKVFIVPYKKSYATTYQIEVSEDQYFQQPGIIKTGTGPTPKQSDYYFSNLKQNTTYYVRCRVNNEYWGDRIRSFTTHQLSNGVWTVDGEYGIDAPLHKTSLFVVPDIVVDATSYMVEVNSNSTFTGTSIIKTGAGPTPIQSDFWFSGLAYNKKYHVRVSIDGGASWGTKETFTTHNVGETNLSYVSDGIYGNQYAINYPNPTRTGLFVVPKQLDDVSSYTVEVCASTGFSDATLQTKIGTGPTVNKSNYWFSGLQNSTTYYVRVRTDIDPYGKVYWFTTEAAAKPMARTTSTISEGDNEFVNVAAEYNAYPNPFNNELNIRIDSDKQERVAISITDLSGKMVYQSLDHQTNQTILLGENLNKGVYIIHITHGENTKLLRVVKN